ncbi:MAG: hypothetical protein ABIG55_04795 [Candidatus Omnitrophota bacterium]
MNISFIKRICRPSKKIVTGIVLAAFSVCFVFTDAWAIIDTKGPLIDQTSPSPLTFFNIDAFTIPEHLGEVKYSNKADSDKVIIHIQDAHCNPFAQHKIADIIDYLNEEYDINTLNLEGGAGSYDLDIFTSISDKTIRREVADHFLKTGEINGAEFYAINNPGNVTLWGIEDTDLYLSNLKVYRDSLAHKDEVDKYIKELSHLLNNLKRHIYSPGLLKIDMVYGAYKSGNMEFREYLDFLIKRSEALKIDTEKLPNIHFLSRAMSQEDKVDFKRANIERNLLVDELKKNLSRTRIRELVSKTIDFRTKKISPKIFYGYLLEEARKIGIHTDPFPALISYEKYINTYESCDRSKIMEEVAACEMALRSALYRNDTEKTLDTLSKNMTLTKNIFNLSLTKKDYEYYLTNKASFEINDFIHFIETESPRYKITAKLSPDIVKLDDHRENFSEFYEYSFDRDAVFLKNLHFPLLKTTGRGTVTVLITGGFHTENLCELLKEEDISCVSIMPKFANENDYKSPYLDLLAGETNDMNYMLRSVITEASTMAIASMLSEAIASNVWGKANIDTFRAAVLVQEQIAKGKEIVKITKNGENIIFHMKDGTTETMPIRTLLDAVHQEDIDGQMERLNEDDFENIEDLDDILNEIIGFLSSIGADQQTLDQVRSLKGKNIDDRALIRLVHGVTFRGHAGGQGIRINGNLKENRQELKAVIIHEIIAGLFKDHFLAEKVEQAFREDQHNENILARSPALEKEIWNMTPEERLEIDRDFAQEGGKIRPMELRRNMTDEEYAVWLELNFSKSLAIEFKAHSEDMAMTTLKELLKFYISSGMKQNGIETSDEKRMMQLIRVIKAKINIGASGMGFACRLGKMIYDHSGKEMSISDIQLLSLSAVEELAGIKIEEPAEEVSFGVLRGSFHTALKEKRFDDAEIILKQINDIPDSELNAYDLVNRRNLINFLVIAKKGGTRDKEPPAQSLPEITPASPSDADRDFARGKEKTRSIAQEIVKKMNSGQIEDFLKDESPASDSFYLNTGIYLTADGTPGRVMSIEEEFGLTAEEGREALLFAREMAKAEFLKEQLYFSEILGPFDENTTTKTILNRFSQLLKEKKINLNVLHKALRSALQRFNLTRRISHYASEMKDIPEHKTLVSAMERIVAAYPSLTPDKIEELDKLISFLEQNDLLRTGSGTVEMQAYLRESLYGLDILNLDELYSPNPEYCGKIRKEIGDYRKFGKDLEDMKIVEAVELFNGQILLRATSQGGEFIEIILDGEGSDSNIVFKRKWDSKLSQGKEYFRMPEAFREKVLKKAEDHIAENPNAIKQDESFYVQGLIIKDPVSRRIFENTLASNPLVRYLFLSTQMFFRDVEVANIWIMVNIKGGSAGTYCNRRISGGVGIKDVFPHEYIHFLYDVMELGLDDEISDYFGTEHRDFLESLNEVDNYKGLLERNPDQMINEAFTYYLTSIFFLEKNVGRSATVKGQFEITFKDIDFFVKKGFLPAWMKNIDRSGTIDDYFGRVRQYIEKNPGSLGELDILKEKTSKRIKSLQDILRSGNIERTPRSEEIDADLRQIEERLRTADLNDAQNIINEVEKIKNRIESVFLLSAAEQLQDINIADIGLDAPEHEEVNKVIRQAILEGRVEDKGEMNGKRILVIKGVDVLVGEQRGHAGIERNVIYIAEGAYSETLAMHEAIELQKWQEKALELAGMDKATDWDSLTVDDRIALKENLRNWIKDNIDEARALEEQYHNEANLEADVRGQQEVVDDKLADQEIDAEIEQTQVTETLSSRQAVTLGSFAEVDRKADTVRTVVGVPVDAVKEILGVDDEELLEIVNRGAFENMFKEISEGLGKNEFGRFGDKHQVVPFIIYRDTGKTEKSYQTAIDKAQDGLSDDGRVILFAPEMDKGPKLAESAQDRYADKTYITVVPDAYTDANAEAKEYPDIMIRTALSRHIAFCYNGKDQTSAIAAINSILSQVSSNDPITDVKQLLSVMNRLRIKAIDYTEITEWQESQKAVATSL